MVLGVEYLAVVGRGDVTGGDSSLFVYTENDAVGFVVVGVEFNFFQVENNFDHILKNIRNGLELMINSVDLDRNDGGTFERGKKDAAEGVAHGVSIAGLKGFGSKLRVGGGSSRLVFNKRLGHFKTSKTNWHDIF